MLVTYPRSSNYDPRGYLKTVIQRFLRSRCCQSALFLWHKEGSESLADVAVLRYDGGDGAADRALS